MPVRLLVAITAFGLGNVAILADETAGRLQLGLANMRWQVLPSEVRAVIVGPDRKTWYQFDSDPKDRSAAQIRHLLEAEYRQPVPQISGAALALLEPNGRAWFYLDNGTMLCGYDGKEWIERPATEGSNFVGECPTRGQLYDNEGNRYIGGRAWFRDWQGIHVHDGQRWSYKKFYERMGFQGNEQPRFAVSPGGEYAVALRASTQKDGRGDGYFFWKFEDGEWREQANLTAEQVGYVGTFCVTDEGVMWFVSNSTVLRSLALAKGGMKKAEATDERIDLLIRQLGDEAFAEREQATEQLAKVGPAIKQQLEVALAKSSDPEVKTRLGQLLKRLEPAKPVPGKRPPVRVITPIGSCRVEKAVVVVHDDDGNLYVVAESVSDDANSSVAGLALFDRDGNHRVVPISGPIAALRNAPSRRRLGLRTQSGDALWMASPMRRLNLKTGEPTAEILDSRFTNLHAVNDDGHVFLSQYSPNIYHRSPVQVAAFRPEIAESRLLLKVDDPVVIQREIRVATKGDVWANLKGQGLARYDGLKWLVAYPDDESAVPLACGLDAVMFGRGSKGYLLCQGTKVLGEGKLQNLIQEHRTLITKAFAPAGYRSMGEQNELSVIADSSGNIWVREGAVISCLVGDNWISAQTFLSAAGSRSGQVELMAPVGSGKLVYLSDMHLVHDHGKSFLAKIAEGKIALVDAPHACREATRWGLLDSEGALWIPGQLAESVGTSDHILGHRTARFGDQGLSADYKNEGWPMLVDKSGIVWLGSPYGLPTKLRLWRQGKIVQTIELAGLDAICSDKPNSVYCWTANGLQHFVGEEVGGGYQYRPAATYAVERVVPMYTNWAYSEHNLITLIHAGDGPLERRLHFVRLPEDSQ